MHLHSLYYKFIIGYLIFGLLGFITIATFSSHITYRQLQREQADALYDEANLIAGRYSGPYQGQTPTELSAAYPQLNAIASFLQADIWVVNRRGNIILDSNDSLRAGQLIEDFDPTATGNKSYSIGNYYGMFNYDVLSVSAPITGNYNTYGYVLIHMPLSVIYAGHNTILNLIYITALILFGLSLIILLVFAKTV